MLMISSSGMGCFWSQVFIFFILYQAEVISVAVVPAIGTTTVRCLDCSRNVKDFTFAVAT